MLLAGGGAGLAVAGYSALDAYGIRLHRDWAGFTAWIVVLDNVTFLAYCRWQRGRALWGDLMGMRQRILVSGGLGLTSFVVFLWALGRSPVGPVVAVRETTILFAMLFGALVYREALTARRLVGGVFIIAGVALISVAK